MARSEPIVGRWDGTSVKALARIDRERMQALEPDTLLAITVYRPKSEEALRFIHALLAAAAENAIEATTAEGLKQRLKLAGGWISGARVDPDGTVHAKLRSLGDMNADELSRYIDQAIDLIETEIVPGVDHRELMREVGLRTKRRRT